MFFEVAKLISIVLVGVSFFISMARVVQGPSTADRVVAMDLISMLVIGFISLYCIEVNQEVYLNATIILALVSFLSVIAIARYVERPQQESLDPPADEEEEEQHE
jgi:multicomponent Na+:H+ antiporter subunit F